MLEGDALRPGRRVGPYVLERRLGEGGMGEVWQARHITLGRDVAIKFADGEREWNDALADRFLREARLVAAVRHRNVVDVIDTASTAAGRPYLVMELIVGETLADVLEAKVALSVREAAVIGDQLLSALGACHRAGVVHRDVKPENVFVTRTDEGTFVTLVDFGVSRSVGPSARDRRSAVPTEEGILFGTPEYMSPEQARGDTDIDRRTDIYAVGVLLYEMVSGRLPFEGQSAAEIAIRVALGQHTPLEELRPDLSEIAAVVRRAMAHDRDERFDDAASMRGRLRAAVGRSPSSSRPVEPPSDRTERRSERPTRDSGPAGVAARPSLPGPGRSSLTAVIAAGGALAVLVAGVTAWSLRSATREPMSSQGASGSTVVEPPVAEPPVMDAPPIMDAPPRTTVMPSTSSTLAEDASSTHVQAEEVNEVEAGEAPPVQREQRRRRRRERLRRRNGVFRDLDF